MNKINSLIVTNGRLDIPLVVIKKKDKLMGFVPALHIDSVWGEIGQEDEIIKTLKELVKVQVREMAKRNEPFPFFPDSSTITFEYNPIRQETLVAHIKVKNNKK